MYYQNANLFNNKYFDKRIPEEDNPLDLEPQIHQKYQQLEIVYDDIFDENSHNQAKV
jgi:hypothetical protein